MCVKRINRRAERARAWRELGELCEANQPLAPNPRVRGRPEEPVCVRAANQSLAQDALSAREPGELLALGFARRLSWSRRPERRGSSASGAGGNQAVASRYHQTQSIR